MNNTLISEKTIHEKDLKIYTLVDSPAEAVAAVKKFYTKGHRQK